MWIADMDFATAPEVIDAMKRKVETGIFGYEWPQEDYFSAVSEWYSKIHGVHIPTEWMIFSTGVVPAISSIVRRASNVGDDVVVLTPVYNIFYNSILNNGRHVREVPLAYDSSLRRYSIDFTTLESALSGATTTLMILCNPQNPTGKVWTRGELSHIASLCSRYGVTLLSDEIHGDLVLGDETGEGPDYTPISTLEPALAAGTISVVSPSKTFNLAALHAATVIVPEEHLRALVNRGLNTDEVAEPNLLALPGSIAAYTHGEPWLAALKGQLRRNVAVVRDFLESQLPQVHLVEGESTYLLWLDCADVDLMSRADIAHDSSKLASLIRTSTGLILSDGAQYRGNGKDFLRMNIACPESLVREGLARLKKAFVQ
jgi:cystathionine beta-lyase